jgi:glycosyltransferase involved in cell wall biosynthesis
VLDGETGLLVRPRDPQALAEAMAKLMGDDPLRQRLGRAGPDRAALFDITRNAEGVAREYHAARALVGSAAAA